MPESGNTYKIINLKNGTALDLSGSDTVSITGWDSHDGDNQKWVLNEVEPGQWTIQNVAFGKFLAADGEGEGANIVGAEDPFNWDVRNEGDDWRIFVPHAPFNVDLDSQGEDEIPAGARVQLWSQWAGDNQVWKFEDA
ncbi:hypothetical protein TWF730_005656 [Orbilia blumenaviensis]|uniref:Ricin B lectin domain-containing protein n=1 Tax=Orbilia blumenaviensis TaxID=1796055 RepID=A0AAV9VJ11_9PEZI